MAVLVTGAAGLIGSIIVRNLLARGEAVIALDRDLATGRLDEPIADRTITAVQIDITDAAAVGAAVGAVIGETETEVPAEETPAEETEETESP